MSGNNQKSYSLLAGAMIRRCDMRRSFFYSAVALLLMFGTGLAGKINYRVFKPEGGDKHEFLKSDGKKYKYFILEQNRVIEFNVSGPTRAKIRVRPGLEGGIKSADFEIQIWENDKLIAGRKANSRKSRLSTNNKGVDIGLARDIFFKVPRGKHSYKIRVVSSNIKKFYVRFYQEKKKRKPKYVTYKPSEFDKTVKLKSEKSNITYYLVDKDGGASLTILGPAEIRVYCRANFDKNIKEKTKFGLGVFENGEAVKKFTGIAKKSSKTVFEDRTDLIPSTLHKYTLRIPSGKHNYTFKKINSAAPTLAIRFKMKEDGLGKKN
jgi:hypothetical protein